MAGGPYFSLGPREGPETHLLASFLDLCLSDTGSLPSRHLSSLPSGRQPFPGLSQTQEPSASLPNHLHLHTWLQTGWSAQDRVERYLFHLLDHHSFVSYYRDSHNEYVLFGYMPFIRLQESTEKRCNLCHMDQPTYTGDSLFRNSLQNSSSKAS